MGAQGIIIIAPVTGAIKNIFVPYKIKAFKTSSSKQITATATSCHLILAIVLILTTIVMEDLHKLVTC